MNCKAILFFFSPICKRQLESFLDFVCWVFFLKYHRFEYETVPFFWWKIQQNLVKLRRWFHRKWHMSRVGANDSLNKYKNLLPLAIIDQEHRGSGFSLLQCQYEFEVGSAHPWKKGAQNIISCIKIRYFRDTRREAWNIFPYFMVYSQPVNAFWTLTAIAASIQARSLFSGVFAHQSHICPLHYVGIC